jgi:hypothetical protein
MPWGPVVAFIPVLLQEWREEEIAQHRADDDGMPPPYIKLDCGINEPRALSWAEERALREDLRLSVDPISSARLGRTVYRYPMGEWTNLIYGSTGQ